MTDLRTRIWINYKRCGFSIICGMDTFTYMQQFVSLISLQGVGVLLNKRPDLMRNLIDLSKHGWGLALELGALLDI